MGSLLSLTQIPKRVLYFLSIPDKVETAEKLGKILKKKKQRGLPRYFSGKESACQCKTHSIPESRKIPHAREQLSQCTTTIEPVLQSLEAATTDPMCQKYRSLHALEPMLHSKRSHRNEKFTHHSQRKACTAMKTQHNQK